MASSLNTSLQDQLDRITQNTRALVQPKRLAISEQMVSDLFSTGVEDRILPVGAQAPSFTLEDARTGKPVNSTDLLALGPLSSTSSAGAGVLTASPNSKPGANFSSTPRARSTLRHHLPPDHAPEQLRPPTTRPHLPLLADPGAVVAEQFGLAYSVPPEYRRYYQSILINIPFNNAGLNYQTATEASWRLPLPRVFVIAQDGSHPLQRSPRRLPGPPRTCRRPRRTLALLFCRKELPLMRTHGRTV